MRRITRVIWGGFLTAAALLPAVSQASIIESGSAGNFAILAAIGQSSVVGGVVGGNNAGIAEGTLNTAAFITYGGAPAMNGGIAFSTGSYSNPVSPASPIVSKPDSLPLFLSGSLMVFFSRFRRNLNRRNFRRAI